MYENAGFEPAFLLLEAGMKSQLRRLD